MVFMTQYDYILRVKDLEDEIFTCSGERYQTNYHPVYDEKGVWHLEEDEKKFDLYADIQSHAESCDINVLIARYKNGETDVLNQVQSWYGDVTDFPDNYAAMLNNVMAGEALFNQLPVDVKEKFSNDFVQFMASAGSDEWFANLGVKVEQDPVSEHKEEKE